MAWLPVMAGGFEHWVWIFPVVMIGGCIGSFLNVVIHRVPLGISVNTPKRSFCPVCKEQLKLWHNIPVISWLILRGKCAFCGAPISIRYPLVELLAAVLFAGVWVVFPVEVVLFLWVMVAILIAITWIDAEHLIIPVKFTWWGAGVGLVAAVVWPPLSDLAGYNYVWWEGFIDGVVGWLVGFFGLWLVVELGKRAFGKKDLRFKEAVAWRLQEPEGDEEPLWFVIDDERMGWWDLFSRKTDRLLVEATEIRVDGRFVGEGVVAISEEEIALPDGDVVRIEEISSIEGKATGTTIPREAMGMGDVHLLGMLGAFLGWTGVFFSLFSASLFAIVAAVLGRVGFGRQLPFGPFLALGGLVWMFGGWRLWRAYMDFVGF